MEKDFVLGGCDGKDNSPSVSKGARKRKGIVEVSEEEARRRLEMDVSKLEREFDGDEEENEEDPDTVSRERRVDKDSCEAEDIGVERLKPETVPMSKLRRNIRHLARSLYGKELGEQEEWLARNRPKTRGMCPDFRPCPFLSCRHHLYLDVTRNAGIKFNFPDVDPAEMPFSCSLDIAREGGHTLEEVAAFLNMTRERLRQIELLAVGRFNRTIRDPSRRLPDGGYLKWEDVEEYGDEGDSGGDGSGLDMEDSSEESGGDDVSKENVAIRQEEGVLDFSMDNDE